MMPTPSIPLLVFWTLLLAITSYCLTIAAITWFAYRTTGALLYAGLFGCLTGILWVNVLVRTSGTLFDTAPVDACLLVSIQRGLYPPLLLFAFLLLDMYSALLSGKPSVLARLAKRMGYGKKVV